MSSKETTKAEPLEDCHLIQLSYMADGPDDTPIAMRASCKLCGQAWEFIATTEDVKAYERDLAAALARVAELEQAHQAKHDLWLDAINHGVAMEARVAKLEGALTRIQHRARAIITGNVTTGEIGAADYDDQVSTAALRKDEGAEGNG